MNVCSCAQCLGRTIERATKEKRGHSAPCVRRYATSCSCSGCRAVEGRDRRERELEDARERVIQAAKALAAGRCDQYDLTSELVEAVETLERLERESS